jgi:DNA-binding PadR family transcriptional regulator
MHGHHHGHHHRLRHAHEEFPRDDGRGERHGRRHGHGRPRLFDYGDLRLVILALIAERPRHGYELIKAIEERLGGAYAPSPGVVYPTLSMLEDLGHVAVAPAEGGRKLHSITPSGQEHLAANAGALAALVARMDAAAGTAPPPTIVRAMENVKTALRLRLTGRSVTPEEADALAAALDHAAAQISRI